MIPWLWKLDLIMILVQKVMKMMIGKVGLIYAIPSNHHTDLYYDIHLLGACFDEITITDVISDYHPFPLLDISAAAFFSFSIFSHSFFQFSFFGLQFLSFFIKFFFLFITSICALQFLIFLTNCIAHHFKSWPSISKLHQRLVIMLPLNFPAK